MPDVFLSSFEIIVMMKDIRKYENLHIAFWLIKDACWCLLFKPLGMLMIIPTLYVAIDITWRSRKIKTDLFHNTAVTLWICANATWMTGEFFFEDHFRSYAMIFFTLGLLVIAYFYLFVNGKEEERETIV
jgi:hypothetical protein